MIVSLTSSSYKKPFLLRPYTGSLLRWGGGQAAEAGALVRLNEAQRAAAAGDAAALQALLRAPGAAAEGAGAAGDAGARGPAAEEAVAGVAPGRVVGEVEYVQGRGFVSSSAALRGYTLAHFAAAAAPGCERGSKRAALELLVRRYGADPHRPAAGGVRPVHVAVGDVHCLRALVVDCRASVDTPDADGRPAPPCSALRCAPLLRSALLRCRCCFRTGRV